MRYAGNIALRVLATCAAAVAACASQPRDDGGHARSPLHGAPGSIAVIVFGATDCPIANAYAPELERIWHRCAELGIDMTYVYPANDVTDDVATAHARDYHLTMPRALDPSHAIVRSIGATVTPEAAVVRFADDDRFEVLYLGRIDDWYAGVGKRRIAASKHDLVDAIEAARAGQAPSPARTEAFGCFIERTP
ncbi:MAG: redoxin family protein [Phycisphaerales bacterium]